MTIKKIYEVLLPCPEGRGFDRYILRDPHAVAQAVEVNLIADFEEDIVIKSRNE